MITAIESNPARLCMKNSAHLQRLKEKREGILSGTDVKIEVQVVNDKIKPKTNDWEWNPNPSSPTYTGLFQTTCFSFDSSEALVELPIMEPKPIQHMLPPISQILNTTLKIW